jgi:hypothetical protein
MLKHPVMSKGEYAELDSSKSPAIFKGRGMLDSDRPESSGLPLSDGDEPAAPRPYQARFIATILVVIISGIWAARESGCAYYRSLVGRLAYPEESRFVPFLKGISIFDNAIENELPTALHDLRKFLLGKNRRLVFGWNAIGSHEQGADLFGRLVRADYFSANIPKFAASIISPKRETLNDSNGYVYVSDKGWSFSVVPKVQTSDQWSHAVTGYWREVFQIKSFGYQKRPVTVQLLIEKTGLNKSHDKKEAGKNGDPIPSAKIVHWIFYVVGPLLIGSLLIYFGTDQMLAGRWIVTLLCFGFGVLLIEFVIFNLSGVVISVARIVAMIRDIGAEVWTRGPGC